MFLIKSFLKMLYVPSKVIYHLLMIILIPLPKVRKVFSMCFYIYRRWLYL